MLCRCAPSTGYGKDNDMETKERTFKVAGIDVHKSMLTVVIADAAREGEFQFERRSPYFLAP